MAEAEGELATLAEFAAIRGAPSEPTLRKLIADNPDFPVVKVGSNGSKYEIPVRAAMKWLQDKAERDLAAKRARSEAVMQVAMDFLGEDAATDLGDAAMSADEHLKWMQTELAATKVRLARGELIRKGSVEAAFAKVLVMFRRKGETFTARLGKRVELPRELIAQIDALMEQDHKALAAEMEQIVELTDADGEAGDDPAV